MANIAAPVAQAPYSFSNSLANFGKKAVKAVACTCCAAGIALGAGVGTYVALNPISQAAASNEELVDGVIAGAVAGVAMATFQALASKSDLRVSVAAGALTTVAKMGVSLPARVTTFSLNTLLAFFYTGELQHMLPFNKVTSLGLTVLTAGASYSDEINPAITCGLSAAALAAHVTYTYFYPKERVVNEVPPVAPVAQDIEDPLVNPAPEGQGRIQEHEMADPIEDLPEETEEEQKEGVPNPLVINASGPPGGLALN